MRRAKTHQRRHEIDAAAVGTVLASDVSAVASSSPSTDAAQAAACAETEMLPSSA